MKNKKLLFPVLLPSLMMIGLGSKTMIKYLNTPADWHFIVSLISTSVFVWFALAIVRKYSKEQKYKSATQQATNSVDVGRFIKNNL